jgi:hypothetical protein
MQVAALWIVMIWLFFGVKTEVKYLKIQKDYFYFIVNISAFCDFIESF